MLRKQRQCIKYTDYSSSIAYTTPPTTNTKVLFEKHGLKHMLFYLAA